MPRASVKSAESCEKLQTKTKGKPRGKPFVEGDDPRRNVTGENRQPISKLYDEYLDKTPDEIIAIAGGSRTKLGRLLIRSRVKNDLLPMRHIVAIRGSFQAAEDPGGNIGLVKEITERTEGKIKDVVEHQGIPALDAMLEIAKKAYADDRSRSKSKDKK